MITSKQVTSLVQLLQERSSQPIQNPALIRRYLAEALSKGTPITFFDWECPPRRTEKTADGKTFVNYDVDLKRIFKGERFDEFTELPRAVELRKEELETLEFLNTLDIPYRFVKLIADTNAYYLTPESLKRYGGGIIRAKYKEFKKLLAKQMQSYPARTKVYLYSELILPYKTTYDFAFRKALRVLTDTPYTLVNREILEAQYKHTQNHLGMTDQKAISDLSLRTIASYGAEGLVFEKLCRQNKFSNCVWLNLREVDRRTVAITNCLRRKGALPMWYPVDEHAHTHAICKKN